MTTWGGRRVGRLLALTIATYGARCHLCGQPIDTSRTYRTPDGRVDLRAPSVDHVLPRALGGTDDLANLRPSHQGCNRTRSVRPVAAARETMRRRRGTYLAPSLAPTPSGGGASRSSATEPAPPPRAAERPPGS